jgi:perosamine synthetase
MGRLAPNPRHQIYKPRRFYRALAGEILSGSWSEGDDVQRLESDFSRRYHARYALATAQGRLAVFLAMKAVLGDKRRVLLSPYTIFDIVNMVVAAGGEPVFVDLEPGTCNVSADGIESLLDETIGAVFVTHLQGLACDIQRIKKLCDDAGVPLIEDSCQALGTEVEGQQVGTFGDVGIFSFGLAKNVNCLYGGMAVSRDAEVDARMRELNGAFNNPTRPWLVRRALEALATDQTLSPLMWKAFFFWLFRFGYLHDVEALNKRVTVEDDPVLRPELPQAYERQMSPMQARLVLTQLDAVVPDREARRSHARLYRDGLSDVSELTLPPDDPSHGYLVFPVLADDRHAVARHLMRNRRDCTVQHLKNCADLECFAAWYRDCPVARKTADSNLLLPTYPRYGEHEVELNIEAIRSFFGR